jgi:hypothetical protein
MRIRWRRRLETRELLLIAFFAAFIVVTRVAMRWHLHIPGHAMLPAAFALVLVRACSPHRAASTLCGTLAGLVVAAFGMGQGGPLIVLQLALPGLVIDLGFPNGARSRRGDEASGHDPGGPPSMLRGGLIGALAGASGFVPVVLIEGLAGVDPEVIALHALTSATGKAVFGAAGGAAAAWVARELRHHGLLNPSRSF